MIWRNPWAWLGLLSIAVPVIIHLLTRRSARVQHFPTLRFLAESRRIAARRIRLHDPLLLALRILTLVAAVAALAQPYVPTAARDSRTTRTTSRAIIVDTSASMQRAARAGGDAITAARDSARASANGAAATVIETASPGDAIAGAAAWLETQPGQREIIVISDFQSGSIDPADIEPVPPEVGLRFVPIAVAVDSTPITFVKRSGATETTVRVMSTPDASSAEWTTRRVTPSPSAALRVLAHSQALARSSLDAALAAGAPFHADTARPVAIVFEAVAVDATETADRPWMGDVLAGIATDSLIERSGRGVIDNREHLLLFTRAEPGTLESAQLISDVLHALDASVPSAELDPAVIPAQTIEAWAREARRDARAPANDASDGRWLWLVALGLLATESWLRWRRARVYAA